MSIYAIGLARDCEVSLPFESATNPSCWTQDLEMNVNYEKEHAKGILQVILATILFK